MLLFYFAAGSSSLAPHIALEEANAPYQGKALLLSAGQQRGADFLAINPRGRVPALVVDGQCITENVAILTYIAHRFPQAGLLSFDDDLLLARIFERMAWYAASLHIAIAQLWRTERFTSEQDVWPAVQEGGRQTIENGFREIETKLDGPWVLGDRYSVLDGYTHVFWRWGQRLGMDMTQLYPRWALHSAILLARPAVKRALAAEKAATGIHQVAGA